MADQDGKEAKRSRGKAQPKAGGDKQPAAASHPAAAAASEGRTGGAGIDGINVIQPGEGEEPGTKASGLAALIPAPETGKKRGVNRKRPEPKKTKAKQNDTKLTADMVANLLGVVFNIMATRMGQHWAITCDEAKAIAEPTARILERHNLTEKSGAYADYIALVVAIGGIIVPKFLLHNQLNPKPKKGLKPAHVEPIQQKQRADTQSGANGQTAPGTGGNQQGGKPSPLTGVSPLKAHLAGVTAKTFG